MNLFSRGHLYCRRVIREDEIGDLPGKYYITLDFLTGMCPVQSKRDKRGAKGTIKTVFPLLTFRLTPRSREGSIEDIALVGIYPVRKPQHLCWGW